MPKHLVIVESPTKAKTIKRFLGKDYSVHASMGHVRDLPSRTLAVDIENNFEAVYEVPKDKETVVKNLQKELNDSEDLWIATDEDREGEAIGWHLVEVLKRKKKQPVKRIAFHEITETAIREAMANPRELDASLVEAQQARRILDRLVGYTLSPFLWKKVYRGLSAGRVQSVAVRIIVDREREIQAFNAEEYWTVEAHLETDKSESFIAQLKEYEGKKCAPTNKKEAQQVLDGTTDREFSVAAIEEKELKKNPPAPFTTSTLQQEAGRKLSFSVKQTMVVAQQLYEGVSLGKGQGQSGLITYMRTDSVNLSSKALEDAARTIEKLYGREYVLSEPRKYKTKNKSAQEAHEAIRPTEMERTPESLSDVLDHQQLKLYTLIWNRTMATQMASAELKRVGADITAGAYTFRATGQTILFDGFMRVYREDRDEPEEDERSESKEADDGEKFLPPLSEGQRLKCDDIIPEQHFTKPPPRYTEASLVKKLEEEGIGRPSTYAPTISTVQQRGYITKEGKQLLPQDIAFTVTDLLAEHFSDIVDLKFTANMEQSLDNIAEGSQDRAAFLGGFYGPFQALVAKKGDEVKKEDVLKERELGIDPKTSLAVVVRTGRFGPYVQLGRLEDLTEEEKKKKVKPKSASLPDGVHKDEITLDQAMKLFDLPRELATMEGEKLIVNTGRFGPYLRLGKFTLSLPKELDPYSVTGEEAKELIKEGREKAKKAAEPLKSLGKDPETGGEIQLKDGRYGPYVSDGKTNASLGKKYGPDDITFAIAVELLEKKRKRPPRKFKKK
ncbi:type I DNA topoisomerase [Candidatus Peregrinibacteria bacterium CG10_big_fil_rev_8_21_14_0_10_49_24]|nr:MAG: DNA topoisomerase I [Candidatus Peregrinibacteria bacterium CG11_big_fil_rev_8_21_14_0_20_49_14]PIR50591.1 MAG: type I DNA topoisomerase [Candidatus Peregrinibacteria bacterium CG10_big_fil_rev_8_21_14_0_10_49_24]PJA67090.1 MAG: type I DNA topoisomerase [Candidatus Peregrinibacteria bacterium CG_4_9_14_3_um_filter_49_12]